MPAAMELSTGLTEDAWTRTSTSRGPGVGAGRSSRRAGDAPASSRVMAFMLTGVPLGFEGSVGCSSERLGDVVADLDFRLVATLVELEVAVGERVGVGLAGSALDEEVQRHVGDEDAVGGDRLVQGERVVAQAGGGDAGVAHP